MARHHLTRDRRLMAVLTAVTTVCLGSVGWQLAVAAPDDPEVVNRTVSAGPDGRLDLTFTGDTMLGDGAQQLIDAAGPDAPLKGVTPLLGGDVTIVNAEGPITTVASPANPGAKYSYAVAPAGAKALARAGVDVLGLGNNHAMDRGGAGLAETQQLAQAAGMSTFGAGADLAQAMRPLLLSSPQETVAVIAFGENFGPLHRSTETTPGMVPLTVDRVERGVLTARAAGATRIVAFVHWGDNYADVNAQQRYWAGVLVDAGYDAVIGTGAHVLQPVELLHGTPVAYGLGNLAFGAPGRFASYGKVGVGAVAHLRWDATGRGTLRLDCVQTDNTLDGYVARACPPTTRAAAQRVLGTRVTWNQNTASISF
ncbi:CapA family protein [Pedococcus bigeumensis]|uniref:CapA family protein n=1 Tax=Pedococcus bigeumensis TaxID=433644 RepID=UPI002FED3BBC